MINYRRDDRLAGKLLAALVLCALALSLAPRPLLAQHGHPLVGTWSGFLQREEGQPIRALVQFTFSADQVISGSLIANGQRLPITDAALDFENWSVTFSAEGKDRAGNMLHYDIEADIENLDSPTERTLVGTWRQGDDSGDFRVKIN